MNYSEWLAKSFKKYIKEREKLTAFDELFTIAARIRDLGNTDQIFEEQTAHLDLDQTEKVRESLAFLVRIPKYKGHNHD